MDVAKPVARTVALALGACALLALGACATTRGALTSSADDLEHASYALAHEEPADSDYPTAREARELADEARDFRHTVEDSAATDEDVRVAFRHVSRTYHDLRDEVERSDSGEARDDLRPVTNAYLDVERAMGGYPDDRHDVSMR